MRTSPTAGRSRLTAAGSCVRQLARLAERGLEVYSGIEVELYVTRLAHTSIGFDETAQPGQPGAPLAVEPIERGYQFLSDSRMDAFAGTIEAIRDGLVGVVCRRARSRTSGAPGRSRSRSARSQASPRPTP